MDRDNSNDYELLYMIYQMDEGSLQIFVKKYQGYIKRRVQQYYWGVHMSLHKEEVILEGIHVLYTSIYTFRDDCHTLFSTYFHSVLDNRLATYYRRLSRNYKIFRGEVVELDRMVEDGNAYQGDSLINHDITLEGKFCIYMADYYETLKNTLRNLQPLERNIVLARIEGYSYEEIAKYLKTDVKKVDNTLTKVRNQKV